MLGIWYQCAKILSYKHRSRLWPKNGASVDQILKKAAMKGVGRHGYATCLRGNNSMHKENSRSIKLAGSSRKALLRDYSSRTCEGAKPTISSARSAKVSAESIAGAQRYKDQREPWQTQKKALLEKLGSTGWLPRKRLSPDTLAGIRALHAQHPEKFTTPVLANQFKVSPEAIRRILKSKWRPNDEEEEERRRRWENRGESIWSQMSEMGIKPPKKWRDMGVGKSSRSKQREPRTTSMPITSSSPGQSIIDTHSITANAHKDGPPLLLADRIS